MKSDVRPPKQKRVVVYMPAEDYNELRAILLRHHGQTVSAWFRQEAGREIERHKQAAHRQFLLEQEIDD